MGLDSGKSFLYSIYTSIGDKRMKILKKPYKKSPFDEAKSLKAKWLKDVILISDKLVERAKFELKREAEYDKLSSLSDEKFLYECFKKNVKSDLFFGNWQILKYFSRILKIKVYQLIKGKWTFTDQDLEMYNYFRNVEVNQENKCKPSILKFNSGVENNFKAIIYSPEAYQICFHYKYKTESVNNELPIPYMQFFTDLFSAIEDMERNSKMLSKKYPDFNLFDSSLYFRNGMLEIYQGCPIIKKRA
jgi:hypothetical protein